VATLRVEHLNKTFPPIERASAPTTAIEDLMHDLNLEYTIVIVTHN
jgi:ABC-type phosphate transport system ATPase subunit